MLRVLSRQLLFSLKTFLEYSYSFKRGDWLFHHHHHHQCGLSPAERVAVEFARSFMLAESSLLPKIQCSVAFRLLIILI